MPHPITYVILSPTYGMHLYTADLARTVTASWTFRCRAHARLVFQCPARTRLWVFQVPGTARLWVFQVPGTSEVPGTYWIQACGSSRPPPVRLWVFQVPGTVRLWVFQVPGTSTIRRFAVPGTY